MSKELGKHDFGGSCLDHNSTWCNTASVGCFEWLRASCGQLKRGKVKVRVSGPIHMADQIKAKAEEICNQLDAGTYTGPKNVRIK